MNPVLINPADQVGQTHWQQQASKQVAIHCHLAARSNMGWGWAYMDAWTSRLTQFGKVESHHDRNKPLRQKVSPMAYQSLLTPLAPFSTLFIERLNALQ